MKITKIVAFLLLLLAFGLGILAWMLGRQPVRAVVPITALPAQEAEPKSLSPQLNEREVYAVVAINKDVAAGHTLSDTDLKLIELPAPIKETFHSPSDLVGRTTVVAMKADSPIFEQQLLEGLALHLEPGQRAVSIGIKEQMAVGHHIRPGDFVDVFMTLDESDKNIGVDTQARLLLAKTRVLAYGGHTVERPPLTAGQKEHAAKNTSAATRTATDEQRQRPQVVNTAVLAVPLDEVQRLALAEKYGVLSLALRHPEDASLPDAAMFAALPPALLPVRSQASSADLSAADKAYAGLKMKDLASGGQESSSQGAKRLHVGSRARANAEVNKARTVEIYNGTEVKTVRY